MKKIILSLAVILASLSIASAQGTIKFYNASAAYAVSTNGTGLDAGHNGTTTGVLDKTANDYYFALLISTPGQASQDPLNPQWTVAKSGGADLIGNNYNLVAGGITGTGGTLGTTVDNWAPGAIMSVEIVGWSASLGTSWNDIMEQLASGSWNAAGYYGFSAIGQVASGGVGAPASPAASLFGASGQIPTGFMLNGVSPVPEPTTMALAALGGASLLLFRRRK